MGHPMGRIPYNSWASQRWLMQEILLEFMGQLTSVRSFLLQSYFLKKLLIDCTDVLGNVQGFRDKFSRAPPWRDTGQWMEFPCLEMCRDLWIKTLVPLPGGIRANGRSFCVTDRTKTLTHQL